MWWAWRRTALLRAPFERTCCREQRSPTAQGAQLWDPRVVFTSRPCFPQAAPSQGLSPARTPIPAHPGDVGLLQQANLAQGFPVNLDFLRTVLRSETFPTHVSFLPPLPSQMSVLHCSGKMLPACFYFFPCILHRCLSQYIACTFNLIFFFLETFFIFTKIFIYLFLAALGLRCCTRAFSSCSKRGLLFVAAHGLLIVVASLVAEHGL